MSRGFQSALARGFFVRPAVVDLVAHDNPVAQDEIFGPIISVMDFESYAEAIKIANGVRYGLTASIFTRDLQVALSFARDVEAGYVWVNESSRHIPGAPFGGFKSSGTGREEDLSELESFTQIQNVHIGFEPDKTA